MKKQFRGLLMLSSDRKGVTALEYGIVAAGLATILVFAFSMLGTDLNIMILGVANSM